MPEKPLFCLGEAWVELGADTVPELAETFRVSVGGWGTDFCRAYVRAGGHAALLSQLGADPFGRKAAAQLAADGIDCTHLCFTDAARTPVVFSGAGKLLPYRAPSAELLYAPEQLDAAALRETALQFFPQADVLLLKDSDLVPLFGSHELRTALFSLFSGHVELIFYSSSDNVFLFTRNVLLQAATSDLTEAQFLRDLARLNTWPDKLAGLRETTLKKLL